MTDLNGIGIDNLVLAEDLFEEWKLDHDSVPDEWKAIFSSSPDGVGVAAALKITSARGRRVREPVGSGYAESVDDQASHAHKQGRVDSLIYAYRDVGYLYADLILSRGTFLRNSNTLPKR